MAFHIPASIRLFFGGKAGKIRFNLRPVWALLKRFDGAQ
jgi:hypothetical protein